MQFLNFAGDSTTVLLDYFKSACCLNHSTGWNSKFLTMGVVPVVDSPQQEQFGMVVDRLTNLPRLGWTHSSAGSA